MSILSTIIVFIACHGGPADHFATFAESLSTKGESVEIYATGAALAKFEERKTPGVIPFSLDETESVKIAEQCEKADVVITDLGHEFDISLQKNLKERAPKTLRYAYYDNPEPFVPGGYSSVAAQVIASTQKVLFANAHLANLPIYEREGKEIDLPFTQRVALGFYPTMQAERIAARRESKSDLRAQFFAEHRLQDRGEKILLYLGGNNSVYFQEALPALLSCLMPHEEDLSNVIILFQQHPGAKLAGNRDVEQINAWEEVSSNRKKSRIIISQSSTETALCLADCVAYYQTSMGPAIVFSGIAPSCILQIGHRRYEDVLVNSGCATVVTTQKALVSAFEVMDQEMVRDDMGAFMALKNSLGMREDWQELLKQELINLSE